MLISADRRQGRSPQVLYRFPDGRGRGAMIDVCRNFVADRPVAGTDRAGMTGSEVKCGDGTMIELRPDAGEAPHSGAAARLTDGFDAPPDAQHAMYRCLTRPKVRSSPRNEPESGECRFISLPILRV